MSAPRVIWLEDDKEQGASIEAYECLWRGGVVVHPTDTVYGLIAEPDREEAYRRIYEIKGRDFSKPLALLIHPQSEHARLLRRFLIGRPELLSAFEAGTLTAVVRADQLPSLPPWINETQPGTVGLRAPAQPDASDFSHAVRKLHALIENAPVWATSVNRSGQPPATTAEEVLAWLDELRERGIDPPELVVLSRTPGSGKPSSVIDLTGPEPRRLR